MSIQSQTDRVSARLAAAAAGLRYSEEFNRIRWTLEEAVDPATQHSIPMPPELRRVAYCLPTAKAAAMSPAELADYERLKAARLAWCAEHWMRVPQWGGLRPPGTEWRYSRAACEAWRRRMQGAGEACSEPEHAPPTLRAG